MITLGGVLIVLAIFFAFMTWAAKEEVDNVIEVILGKKDDE